SSDIMTYSYVFQRAYVVAQRSPGFAALRAAVPELRSTLRSARFREALAARRERLERAASSAARAAPGAAPGATLAAVAEYLSGWMEPDREGGFITRHYSPAGGRMYFTEENARRVDAIRRRLHE